MAGVSIIIPCFNEARTIREVMTRLDAMGDLGVPREVVVVDDASTDGTWAIVSGFVDGRTGWRAFRHEANAGKGAAVRTGLAHATGEAVLIQDADLEYDAADVPALVAEWRAHGGAVFGSRNLGGAAYRSKLFELGGRSVTWFADALYGLRLTDAITGYKLVPARRLREMDLRSRRFEFDVEVPAKLARMGAPIREVAVGYRGRTRAEGKKIRASDGLRLCAALLRWRFWRPDRGWGPVDRFVRALRVAKVLPLFAEGDRVLDLGCGADAYLRRRLQGRISSYVGVDPRAPDDVREPDATFVRADASSPAVPDASCDAVAALAVLEHVDDPSRLLSVALRALAPGGRLILTAPSPAAKPVLDALAALHVVDAAEIGEHKRYLDARALADAATAAGFADVRVTPFEFGLNMLLQARRPTTP